MSNVQWIGHHIETTPPKKPKKLTATRLATVLGKNHWSTPFEVWCAVCRVWEKPFEDTIYTNAGKVIEPIQIRYMKHNYAMSNLRTPTDVYGKDYFKKTFGDFYPEQPVFGGMWDSLLVDENGKPSTVLEFKTSKRSEDWEEDIPEYYAIQAALYAYLLGIDDVIMVASFLDPTDYDHPEGFQPNVHNTITRSFKVSERYPNFYGMLVEASEWWENHVVSGISPDFDEKADAEILKELRTNTLSPATELEDLLRESETLTDEITAAEDAIKAKVKRLDTIKKQLKEYMAEQFRNGDSKVTMTAGKYQWELTRTLKNELDVDRMMADRIYDKYFTK